MRPTFSGYSGGVKIGPTFFARKGALADRGAPRGVVDAMEDLAHPGIDVTKISPQVAAFFVDTAGLGLHIRSAWRFPISLLWWLVRPFMRWVGQFVYPAHEGRVVTRAFAIDRERDGRSDARGIVRTYEDGGAMQTVAYATWARGGVRFMSAAFPVPFGQVLGILRLDPLEGGGAVLTSRRHEGDDAGVWMKFGPLALPAPFGERIELRPATSDDACPDNIPAPTIVGVHEQRLFGVRMVTHHYWMWPSA